MTQSPKTILRSERGQSLVEFALTLPMLLVVMFMVTEFGRALYQYNVLAQATREGARIAVVSPEDQAEGFGEARMDSFLTATMPVDGLDLNVTVEPDFGGVDGVTVVRATAELPFRSILQGNLPTNPGGEATVTTSPLTLRAETVMKSETF
ncbi:MAG TPA: TadE/TadG family type IV pilus assembly protein [Acidimicrobiia bacterium]|nr:TadE/TadG family type IV pilus assembly protein [Acidimicrobiia bacterium]